MRSFGALAAGRRRIASRALGAERGAALLELAICLPMMMVIFTGIVDYALLIQDQMTISKAAAAGAAFGSIYGNQDDLAGMQSAAASAAVGVSGFSAVASDVYTCSPGGAAVTSDSSCSGYGTPIKYVRIVATGTSPTLVAASLLNLPNTLTLQSTTYFRVRWTP